MSEYFQLYFFLYSIINCTVRTIDDENVYNGTVNIRIKCKRTH